MKFFFFIGTTAELIKVVPVMIELRRRGQEFQIIASGQNDILKSELFSQAVLPPPAFTLNRTLTRKTPLGLVGWFLSTFLKGLVRLPRFMRLHHAGDVVLIVHGDTISTVMGAALGKFLRLHVAHIEAGLRSHNFLQPFPEELDRYLTAFFADYHFCPYQSAVENLRKRGGIKVNTGFNTNIDSLAFARSVPVTPSFEPVELPYFIFILHRQENLLNKALLVSLIGMVQKLTQRLRCVFVTHEPTTTRLKELGLYDQIAQNPNIVLSGRRPYAEFIRVLDGSEFILTDGGGNQQECYYLGKPCLILRRLTESEEGVGRNVVISGNDLNIIDEFVNNYERFRYPEVVPRVRPSSVIADTLLEASRG